MFLVVTSRCRLPEGGNCGGKLSQSALRTASGSPESEDSRLPEGLCRCGQPGGCAVHALESGGVRYCRSNERCGSPERSVIPQAEPLHVHPEGRSTSFGDVVAFRRRLMVPQARPSVYFADEIRANTKFTQPQVWPTPAGRTGQSSMTKPRQSSTPFARGAPRCRLRFAATPWS